ncbi:MAG: hypothetical protein JWL83_2694 [Actinomycetia bacterium]|jgi:hypothetical protein|nr:hypothetical protein [Actinomycetes bacterium]
MYAFALVALLALGTLKLVDFLTDAIEPLRPLRSLLTFVVALLATVVLDFSLFRVWGVSVRHDNLGPWVTGVIVAGCTVPWRALFGFLTHDRAESDETLGQQRSIARVA